MRRNNKKIKGATLVKYARIVVSLAVLAMFCVLFTTLSAKLALALDWAPRMQLVPLAVAGGTSALLFWVALTLLFGRLYCSWFCPFGVLQDLFAHLPRATRKQRVAHRYRYSRPSNRLRYIWLAIVAGSAVAGAGVLLTLFDPYSAFGRIGSQLLGPAWWALCGQKVAVASVAAFATALVTLVAIGGVAAWRGRLFCNTLCPAGSSLSILSRYSLLHFDIDTDLCVNCRACERACKAECIDLADHVVDSSRCVMCFNCVDACQEGAIKYTASRKKLSIPMMQRVEQPAATSAAVKIDRRKFMATGLLLATAPALDSVARKIDTAEGRKTTAAKRPVVPPGRRSLKEFLDRCTGCGLCVAHCPKRVLRPSAGQLGWLSALHPVMNYDSSYCDYDCTMCTELCPTEALQPLTPDEKHIFIIGHAQTSWDRCVGCGVCSLSCPRKAIAMDYRPEETPIPDGAMSDMVPKVDTSLCIGCGKCQYVCPATPAKAIVVDGIV